MFIHQMTFYGSMELAEAESDWTAVKTLCENHDTRRMRWRQLEHSEKELEISFQVQL